MATAAFYTLGCKVNQTETAALQKLFAQAGYESTPFDEVADVYVINTCTVTHLSDRKSRQMIRRSRRKNPDAVIVVTGCYAQVSAEDIMQIPDVDLVIGTHSRDKLPQLVQEAKKGRLNCVTPLEEKQAFEALPAHQSGERTRAFLKVQEGCRQFCSYCIVPYARGPLHSRTPEDAATEARRLATQGYSELVLTGVHLGSYGVDLPGELALSDLIRTLLPIEDLKRIRISSIEPTEITPDLIDLMMAYSPVCRHLHIPLQSGDDYVLKQMNRRYDTAEFLQLIRWLRAQIPQIALTTDVMVGFPGETDDQFEHTLEVVRKSGFSRIHTFKYSPRSGTPAAAFPKQVPPPVKEERSRRLIKLSEELATTFRQQYIGETVEVLFEESVGGGQLSGLTEHYVRVTAPGDESLLGQIVEVVVASEKDEELFGVIR